MIEGQPCIAAAIGILQESLDQVRSIAGLRGSFLSRDPRVSSDRDRVPHVAA
jgi:acyl-homoserine lactone synthase